MNKNIKILIDNGHGRYMHGSKQSPDGRLQEGAYAREIASRIVTQLVNQGYNAELVTPEDDDISLSVRCKRINNWCSKLGSANCLSVSVHCNAAGADGKWHNANGWQVYVAQNASSKSKKLAQILYNEAANKNLKGNRSVPVEKYWVQSLAMCRDTKCPAVLTENMFQDNQADVDYLLSDKGKKDIVDLHVQGIIKYIDQL